MASGGEPEPPKTEPPTNLNPNPHLNLGSNSKPKVLVIMGATGSGKSKLAIDLASHFPIEIINADSMQVYKGLDVLTNKVPVQDQKGVPHHLLGTISPTAEFTAKYFRDAAIPIISEIWSRKRLPVIVGGTNYYIQALVSPFLLDESREDMEENTSFGNPGDKEADEAENFAYTYEKLRELDPVASNRIHPNDQRKITQYLSLYARFGVLPSKLLHEKAMENWGRVDNCKYDCCFICVDASLPVLDDYVGKRVDCMVNSGLLDEVFDIYKLHVDCTRGLQQAIGVREFADFLRCYVSECESRHGNAHYLISADKSMKADMQQILDGTNKNQQLQDLLTEAIERVKLNTRRLVRRQKRRLGRLQMLFGWSIHFVDATESISSGVSDDLWATQVVEPSGRIIRSFLHDNACSDEPRNGSEEMNLIPRDLWTQYACEACGNRVLRGAHEWEQHKQGRSHRKRVSRLKKSGRSVSVG
ncbi:tRNA dimethylallyltransferase 2 isoform X1 [Coffea eugenioides]|uniref:tRNA dimethylallyltransferase 2 isoform X1 n=1 Tax=Coffea eugenioides TaxID=49369 RepID=UPI000F6128F2|nr:tRNA dimethylallyltransferase 2 isoform X1 [Coffea eugenioides]XP_027150733.1 tRNA dimethylallyltransferase 2 isoform X1 [Coffea eugenioides]